MDLGLQAFAIHSVKDLCRILKNQSASPSFKIKSLVKSYKLIDFYEQLEVQMVTDAISQEMLVAVKNLNPKNASDVFTLMELGQMIYDFFDGKFQINKSVLYPMACEIAVLNDPRQYDIFRWHSSIEEVDHYMEDRRKIFYCCISGWLKPRLTALLDEIFDCNEPPIEEHMIALTDYLKKYECMLLGWKIHESDKNHWMIIRIFYENLLSNQDLEDFPSYIYTHLAHQIKLMVKIFDFAWTEDDFRILALFTFTSAQIFKALDKIDVIEEYEILENWTYIIEKGIWFIFEIDDKKAESCLNEDLRNQCLQQMDEALLYLFDYVEKCLNGSIQMKKSTIGIIIRCYSKFAQYNKAEQIEAKYGKRMIEWIYTNARLLLSSVTDENCQMVVYAVESLLIKASYIKEMTVKVCSLLTEYLKFDYVEYLRGIDINHDGTLYASRELFTRDDWYTDDLLHQAIKAMHERLERNQFLQGQQLYLVKILDEKLQKKV